MNVPIEFLPFHFSSLRLNTQYSGSLKRRRHFLPRLTLCEILLAAHGLYHFEKFTIFLLTKSLLLLFRNLSCISLSYTFNIYSKTPLTLLIFFNGMQKKNSIKVLFSFPIPKQTHSKVTQLPNNRWTLITHIRQSACKRDEWKFMLPYGRFQTKMRVCGQCNKCVT